MLEVIKESLMVLGGFTCQVDAKFLLIHFVLEGVPGVAAEDIHHGYCVEIGEVLVLVGALNVSHARQCFG